MNQIPFGAGYIGSFVREITIATGKYFFWLAPLCLHTLPIVALNHHFG
jgi:hypothetical protein